jgi:phosphatidylinositol alpha-mannosyltransferase
VDDDELASRLAGADVLCAPSLGGESFGIVLLEAMVARSAVVASDIPGYAAVAGTYAVLVPPGDAGALAAALGALVTDATAHAGRCAPAVLEAAREHASQWDMRQVAAHYVDVYQQVISSAG